METDNMELGKNKLTPLTKEMIETMRETHGVDGDVVFVGFAIGQNRSGTVIRGSNDQGIDLDRAMSILPGALVKSIHQLTKQPKVAVENFIYLMLDEQLRIEGAVKPETEPAH